MNSSSVREVVPKLVGYKGLEITEREWNEQTKDGCAWCTDTVDYEDSEDLQWIGKHIFVCWSCQHINHTGHEGKTQ